MGFFWQLGGGRVSDEFHFFPVSVYYVPGKCFMLEISREVIFIACPLLGRCVVINSLLKQKISARNESRKSHSEGMTFELRPEGQEVMFRAEGTVSNQTLSLMCSRSRKDGVWVEGRGL